MRSAYGARERAISEHPVTIIVDTANVMGARPDGWWRDRAAAAVRLHAEIEDLAASGRPILPDEPDETAPPEFVMVLEGAAKAASSRLPGPAPADTAPADTAPADTPAPGRVRVVQAAGSGDDAIVALVRELPGRRVVVTADRELRDRCRAAGATVLGPGWLLGLFRAARPVQPGGPLPLSPPAN
jgi:8-oxo-dGTP diphosphatase